MRNDEITPLNLFATLTQALRMLERTARFDKPLPKGIQEECRCNASKTPRMLLKNDLKEADAVQYI